MFQACGCDAFALHNSFTEQLSLQSIKSNQINYIIVRPKVDQKAGQLSLPHVGKLKQKNRTKT